MNTKDTEVAVMPLQPDASLSIGLKLASQRKLLGKTVQDIAQQLKVSESVVQALESDDWATVGVSDLFMCGYLRNYAQLIGLTIEPELASGLKQQSAETHLASVNQLETSVTYAAVNHSKRRWNWIWLVLVLGIVLLVLWSQQGLWGGWSQLSLFNDELKR
jgi:cytoskeletal protein RodZ